MTFFDLGVLLVVLGSAGYSAYRGMVRELFGLAGLILGYIVALNFQDAMADTLLDSMDSPAVTHILAFFLLFTGTYLAVYLIGRTLKKYVEKSESISRVDRIWGGVIGGIKGVLLIVVLLFPLKFFTQTYDNVTDDSTFHPKLEELMEVLGDNSDLPQEYIDKLNQTDLRGTMQETVDGIKQLRRDMEDTLENGKEKARDAADVKEKIQEVFTKEDKEKLNDMLDKMNSDNP